jgi:hypothetical protein
MAEQVQPAKEQGGTKNGAETAIGLAKGDRSVSWERALRQHDSYVERWQEKVPASA